MTSVKPYPYAEGAKKQQVQTMFNNIAARYDFLNRLLSAGIDKRWRKKLISVVKKENPAYILDVATGTADVILELIKLNPQKITGIDISAKMLDIGKEKINRAQPDCEIDLIEADCEKLPFSENSFDLVTAAFGVRNFENLDKGILEIFRVLRPGGTVAILEFSQPRKFPVKQLYGFYSKYILPFVGNKISGDKNAYSYLPRSAQQFPSGKKFNDVLTGAGFNHTNVYPLTFGIASLYTGKK